MVTDKALRAKLASIDLEVLKAFARNKKLDVPEGASRTQVIDLVLDSYKHDAAQATRAARHMEVDYRLHSNEERVEELCQKLDNLAKEHEEEARRFRNDQADKLDEETSKFRTNVRYTLGFIVTVGTLLGVNWMVDFFNISRRQDDVERSVAYSHQVLLTNTQLAIDYQISVLDRLVSHSENIMRHLTRKMAVIGEDSWYQLQQNEDRIQRLLSTSRQQARFRFQLLEAKHTIDPETLKSLETFDAFTLEFVTILETLQALYRALRSLEKVRSAGTISDINQSYQAWRKIPLDGDYQTPEFSNYAKSVKAYRNNILGMLELKRFRRVRNPMILATAEEYFKRAKLGLIDEPFPNPDSNLGRVYLLRAQYAKDDETMTDRLRYLEKAQDSFERSIALSGKGRSRSVAENNAAWAYLEESRLHELYFLDSTQIDEWMKYFLTLCRQSVRNTSDTPFAENVWISLPQEVRNNAFVVSGTGDTRICSPAPIDRSARKPIVLELVQSLNLVVKNGDLFSNHTDGKHDDQQGSWRRSDEETEILRLRARYKDEERKFPEHLRRRLNRIVIESLAPNNATLEASYIKSGDSRGYKALAEANVQYEAAALEPNRDPAVMATGVELSCQELRYELKSLDPLDWNQTRERRKSKERVSREITDRLEKSKATYDWDPQDLEENLFCQGISPEVDAAISNGRSR